jgi:hypothetical protein
MSKRNSRVGVAIHEIPTYHWQIHQMARHEFQHGHTPHEVILNIRGIRMSLEHNCVRVTMRV